jgi:hypothetical protein
LSLASLDCLLTLEIGFRVESTGPSLAFFFFGIRMLSQPDTVVLTVVFNFFLLPEALLPKEAALDLTARLLFFPSPSPPDVRGVSSELSRAKYWITRSTTVLLS